VTVIASLVGAEAHRRDDFRAWADAINRIMSGSQRGDVATEAGAAAVFDIGAYLLERIHERMATPRDDLLTVLVKARGEDVLSEEEAVGFASLLLLAGSETTTNLIGNAIWALFEHPAELARTIAEPRRVPAIVEETLRFDGPLQYVVRRATEEVELHGSKIPKNGILVLLISAANRDPRRFPEADRFDPDRDASEHISFGVGTHFCLGAALARAEAESALRQLLPVLDGCERVTRDPSYVDSCQVRGIRRFEIIPSGRGARR
jgi:cytochrome P450